MAERIPLQPDPYFLPGGRVGALLIHGFTGSPPEMRLIGDYLHQQGLTVSAPLLPGHGLTPADMQRSKWEDWARHVQTSLDELKKHCDQVFVGGLSLGSILTLNLALHNPDIRGIILYSPAMWVRDKSIYLTPLLKYIIKTHPKSADSDLTDPEAVHRLWSYDEKPVASAHELLKLSRFVKHHLSQINTPTLIIHSTGDAVIHPQSAERTLQQLGATDKELITLHNSGHCITVDSEWRVVAEKTTTFIRQHLAGESEAGG